jgi:hypothetical protein
MFAKTAFAFFASVATALNAFTSAVEQFNSTDSACCSDRDVGEPRLEKDLTLPSFTELCSVSAACGCARSARCALAEVG